MTRPARLASCRPLALLGAAALAWLVMVAGPATAAELVMLERPGCAWCERWDREIGKVYPLTEEGRTLPLRRVDVTEAWPADLEGIDSDAYTPTFILLDDGVEIARLRGYPGEHFFWPLLGEMLARLPPAETAGGNS